MLKRNIAILLVAQMVAITATISLVTLGGIVGHDLAPTAALATLPLSLFVVGTAVATVPAAWSMSKVGRARGFACGAGLGLGGALVSMAAMAAASFPLFCLGAVFIGFSTAFSQQYRFAAAESVAGRYAAQAVSVILLGSIAGALLGPELAVRGESWVEGAAFAGTFVGVAVCYLFAGGLLLMLRDDRPQTAEPTGGERRPLGQMVGRWTFVVPVLGAAVGQGVMVFVMTAAPLAMHVVDGHSLATAAAVVQAHVLAMYIPSLFTGTLIGRFGAERVMLAGTGIFCAMVAVGFLGREVLHYGASMVALGVGWNFLFIGGTTLLASAHRPAERFRAQAVNDFSVFGLSAVGSLSAGAVIQLFGWTAVLWASIPPVVLTMAVLFCVAGSNIRNDGLRGT
ncbi:MAG: MFS transporter [Gammaproteobacteria bacterium]|nr:MFS transporter [Gammaproteobacteria bacterium]